MPTLQVTPTEGILLQGIADALFKARKVVVITGAGISTNSGIPDFRSENGLYSLIQAQFDAANSEDAARPRCLASTGAFHREHEPPLKRRRLSFEDSGVCIASEESQASSDQETFSSVCNKTSFSTAGGSRRSGLKTPFARTQPDKSSTDGTRVTRGHQSTSNRLVDRALRRSRRAQSLPPEEPAPNSAPVLSDGPARSSFSRRGRSVSPDTRRRALGHKTHSAELRKGSILASSLSSVPSLESRETVAFASKPLRPFQPWFMASERPNDAFSTTGSASIPAILSASQITTPKTSRFFFSSSPLSPPPSVLPRTPTLHDENDASTAVNLHRPPMVFSSSPLSSPPPVLFDPFGESSSASSRQPSSAASSAASSETDETPPSSNPNKSALPNIKGRDLFDASIWADPLRTSVFYTFATTLRQKVKDVQPTESHHFIGHLRNRGKLVRCYTQNIDQIEEKVGLSTSLHEGPGHRGRFSRKSIGATLAPVAPAAPANTLEIGEAASCLGGSSEPAEESKELDKPDGGLEGCETAAGSIGSQPPQRPGRKSNGVECVFLHGSLEYLRCFLCGKNCPWDEEGRAHETMSGRQPECPYCAGATAARQERGKRALGVGKLRPDIVLYGEEHPNAHLISPIVTHDLGLSPDLLLILGTSLKVHGLKILVREFAKTIHSRGGKVVFVNFTKPPESSWGDIIDYWVQWDCDAWVSNLKERIPLLWLPPGTKLPKKKKENSDKPKKRQSTASGKVKDDATKSSGRAESPVSGPVVTSEKLVRPEEPVMPTKPSNVEDAAPAGKLMRPHLPKPELYKVHKPDAETVKTGPAQKEEANERPKMAKYNASKRPPQRPMAVRDDKTNAAWLTWKLMAELRRITGGQFPSSPSSTAAPRVIKPRPKPKPKPQTKPKPKRSRLSAPAASHQSAQSYVNDNPGKLEWKPSAQPTSFRWEIPKQRQTWNEKAEVEDASISEPVPTPGTSKSSIVAAVKQNPRTRRRKTIYGEESPLLGTSQSTAVAKTLPRPSLPKVNTSQAKDKQVVISHKILSDIHQVSMESLELPPLRMDQAPNATLSKPPPLAPLEPVHSPTGPLSAISPNTQSCVLDQSVNTPFYYFDALAWKLTRPPDTTPTHTPRTPPKIKRRNKEEAEAAMALERMKKGSG